MIRQFLVAFILALTATHSFAFFLTPSSLSPPPANRTICQDEATETAEEPYLRCFDEALIKIVSARVFLSTVAVCPNQVIVDECDSNSYANNNVTLFIRNRCDGRTECTFSFDALPNVLCLPLADDPFLLVPEQENIELVYYCQPQRPRFRPFANKRFNPKFSPGLFRENRRISYNHMRSL